MASFDDKIFPSQMDWLNGFNRTGKFPLDRSSMFATLVDAQAYAKGDGSDSRKIGGAAYIGQIISVFENDKVKVYKINADRTLSELGEASAATSGIETEKNARIAQDDKIEGSVGLAADGSHVESNGIYTKGATTVVGEIAKLDAALDATDKKITAMDYTATAADGSYVDGFTQTSGKITAHTTKAFDTALNGTSVKAPQTKVVDAAIKAVKVTAEGDTYVGASVNDAAGRKVTVSTNVETNIASATGDEYGTKLADAKAVKTYVDNSKVSATGDTYVSATADTAGRKVTVAATDKLKNALSNAKTVIDTTVSGESATHLTITKTAGSNGTADSYKFGLADVASQDALEAEIKERKAVEGQSGTTYSANTAQTVTYIKQAQSLNDADIKLDAAIAKEVTDRGTAITDLISGATAGYDTLKGLENKIKEEAEARQTAISGLDYTDTAVTGSYVSKVDQLDGKITATTKVALINKGDKVLSLSGGSVQSTIALKEVTTGLGANVAKQYQLVGINGAQLGDTVIDIPKDTTLQNAEFVLEKPANTDADGNSIGEEKVNGQFLKLTYLVSDEGTTGGTKTKIVYVDMSQLVLDTEVGNGIQNVDHKLFIKIDTASEDFLTTGENGLKLSGVQGAIDAAKASATTTIAKDATSANSANTNTHLVLSESTENGHKEYTIGLKDVASNEALTDETQNRTNADSKIRGSVGLSESGDFVNFAGKTWINDATTIADSIGKIDTGVHNAITAMTTAHTVTAGKFISGVGQSNGKITGVTSTDFVNVSDNSDIAPKSSSVKSAIEAAQAAATTEVNAKEGGHVKVTVTASTDGHKVVTVTEDDIASAASLTDEIAARKAIDGQTGQTYSPNTAYSTENTSGTYYIHAANSLNNADVILDKQVHTNATNITSINSSINNMTEDVTVAGGQYVTSVKQTKGVVTVTTGSLITDISASTASTIAPTTKAVNDLVEAEKTRAEGVEGGHARRLGVLEGVTISGSKAIKVNATSATENKTISLELGTQPAPTEAGIVLGQENGLTATLQWGEF